MTRSLIEQWLPAGAVGAESLRERGSAKAYPPINFLHVWWARRPLIASRAAVAASLLPAWPSLEAAASDSAAQRVLDALGQQFPGGEADYRAWFVRFLGIFGDPVAGRAAIAAANEDGRRLEGNGYGYGRAFTVTPSAQDIELFHRLAALTTGASAAPVVLDSFAGGGSIPFEAARLGCDTIANELNPVASAILQGTVVLPAALGQSFADTIQRFGDRWSQRVEQILDDYYPRQDGESIAGYIWAHTVPCPTTGRPTPLVPDFWLSRGPGGDVALALHVDQATGTIHSEIVKGREAAGHAERSTYKRGVGQSVWTGETFSGEYIREQAKSGELGSLLLAVCSTRPGVRGRQFRAPTPADVEAVQSAESRLEQKLPAWEVSDLVPSERIPAGWKTDEPRRMGLELWSDLFTRRQLFANVTILETLEEVIAEARAELSNDDVAALSLSLSFAMDRVADFNGRLSTWDASRGQIRHVFVRHDYGFKWTFAEFDAAHAVVAWAVENAVNNHRKISALVADEETLFSAARSVSARVLRGSASALPLADASVDAVVTDPPYYDNVMYAEVSDYFYVWLKRSLRDTWPEFTDLVLTDKVDEAVANPSLFRDVAAPPRRGRRKSGDDGPTATELADARYEELLEASFAEAHRVLRDDGVLTVMFTHKRVEAWDTLGAALLDAGFSITASWPVHTESEHSLHQARKNSAASTIFLACRKRQGSEPGYWADIRADVEAAAEAAAQRFASEGMTGVDLTIATYGPVLSVLSDRWPVYTGDLGPDGQPEILRPDAALDLAREKVAALKMRGLLGGRSVEFDRATDWWLLAWSDFQAAEFPFDEARKLSIAMHLDVDDVAKTYKIVKQAAGSVTLLTPAQRRTAGAIDPEATSHDIWLDRLHALMLVYEEDGLKAARSWLNRTGLGEDARLRDLVQAALNAVPRVQKNGEFVRPEAKTLDSLRAALFEDIPVPAVTGGQAQQLGLDDEDEGDD